MERSLIMLIGTTASGKTTLGETIVEQLRDETSIEHISVGNLVRHIGTGAVKSACTAAIVDHLNSSTSTLRLDDEIIYTVINEALSRTLHSNVVLLDGAPRTPTQVNDISELALKDDRHVAGILLTYLAQPDTAIARLLKRRPREFSHTFTETEALAHFDYSNQAIDAVTDELAYHGITPHYIETSGQKHETAALGMKIARFLL